MNEDFNQRNLELRIVILFLVLLMYFLGAYSHRKLEENKSLKAGMQLLEGSLEESQQRSVFKLDSLQGLITQQEAVNLRLKDSLWLLERERSRLNKRTHEKKAAIIRIGDADSLRAVVARHYQ